MSTTDIDMGWTPPRDCLTVGEVAAATGVAASAIRFYERQGLFVSERTAGNQRRYDARVPCLVRVARVAQRVGLSVGEIREMFATLPEDPSLEEWLAMDAMLVAEAERRVADLLGVLEDLRSDRRLCELPGIDRAAVGERP